MAHLLSLIISDDLREANYLMNSELSELLKSSADVSVKFKGPEIEVTVKAVKKEKNEDNPETNLNYLEGGL